MIMIVTSTVLCNDDLLNRSADVYCLPKTLKRTPSTGSNVFSPAGAEGVPNGIWAMSCHDEGRFQVERTWGVMRGL